MGLFLHVGLRYRARGGVLNIAPEGTELSLLKIGGLTPFDDVIMMLIEAGAYRMLLRLVQCRTLLDKTLVVDVERPRPGHKKVYHYELRRAQMLV